MITHHIIESFLKCPYKAYRFFHNEEGRPTEYERLGEELLDMYRADFYVQLHARYDESQVLRGVRFEKKLAIIDTTYILEPVFRSEEVRIRFDALEIALHKKLPSKLVYLPIEVIPNEKVSKPDKLVLAVKCLLLTQAQRRVTPEFGKIVYGRALNSTKVKLAVYAKEARKVLKDLNKTLQSNDPPRFFQINECRTCQFQEDCKAKLIEKDDLSLLAGMNPKGVLKQNNRGIFTVLQFSYTFRPRRRSKKAANKLLRFEPALKALALREKKTYIQELPKLPETDVEVYLDFEGLPDENFIYLIGLIIKHGGTERQFSFWADTKEDEEAIFVQLFETLAPFDNFTVYHYGSYETQALKRLNRKFDNRYEDEVNWLLEKSVNILSFFSSTIYPPTYTNELKDIARFLGFRWSEQDASGIQSIVWRKRWELSHEVEYKNKLVQYNLEDCLALKLTKALIISIGEKFGQEESDINFAKAENVRIQRAYQFKKQEYQIPDFEVINKCAYFDYQRAKIFLQTDKRVRKALKNEERQNRIINKTQGSIDLIPKFCPKCQHDKFKQKTEKTKIIVDLKFIKNGLKKWATECRGGLYQCLKCNHIFSPKDLKTVPRCGNNLMIWSMNQYVQYCKSLEQITEMLLDSFSIQVSLSEMFYFKRKVSEKYLSTYEEIRQNIVNGNLIHADETEAKLRIRAEGYIWVFTNMTSVFYLFRSSRKADFLEDFLKGFAGVLVSDFYTGYDSLPCPQQKCLAHLIRDLNEDLLKNPLDVEYKGIVIYFGKLLRSVIETIDKYGLKKRHLYKHKKEVAAFYDQILNEEYISELAIAYQNRFKRTQGKLFTFLDYDGVPWNNINAEHAIKPFARYRRKVNKAYTEKSLGHYLILLSIQQTCKYRGLSFLEFLKSGETSIEAYTRKVLR